MTLSSIEDLIANPRKLSSRYRVGGGNCLSRVATYGGENKPFISAGTEPEAGPPPAPDAAPDLKLPKGHCGGNCGKGHGHGGGNGTDDEGGGNDG